MTVRLGTARLRAAPVDLPDVPGSMLLHDPDRRWVYAPDAVQPLDLEMVRLRIAELGWSADTIGTSRAPWPGG